MEVLPRKRAAAPPGVTSAVGGWTFQDKNIYPNLFRMIYWQEFRIGHAEQTDTGGSWELLSPLPSLGENRSSRKAVGNCLEDSLWECYSIPWTLQHLKPPKVTEIGSSAQMKGIYNVFIKHGHWPKSSPFLLIWKISLKTQPLQVLDFHPAQCPVPTAWVE